MCIAKIHGATVTETELFYEGSITIGSDLLEESGILPNERVQVVNLNNGSRLETYVIEGEAGSRTICLNGPAARAAQVGDQVHILAYGLLEEEEARGLTLNVVHVDQANRIVQP